VLETGWNQPEHLANAASNGYRPRPALDTQYPFDPRVAHLGKLL
jgi:hypothetical protein